MTVQPSTFTPGHARPAPEEPTRDAPAMDTLVVTLARMLARLGAKHAFGVSGGAMAAVWDALSSSALAVHHFRHESGAAFAATEASFAGGRPAVLFTTTGPGLVNAMTGILAAREERARVIVVSPYTSAASRGRFAIQETSRCTLPGAWYEPGRPFHYAALIEDPLQLGMIERELASGLAQRAGCVAHLAIDTAVQRAPAARPRILSLGGPIASGRPSDGDVAACLVALCDGPFAIWCGFGARDAAGEVAALAHRLQAPVMCSPRGKGVFPEDDPLFVGVTGLAGNASVMEYLEEFQPKRILVLGSRLGEATSFWDRRFVRPGGFVHVDIDATVPGVAFATAPTLAIHGDVGETLRAVLGHLPPRAVTPAPALPRPRIDRLERRSDGPVRPEALMDAIQDRIVDGSEAALLAESGNSFLWTTHRLRFPTPHRYRVSTSFGSMGHAAAGVIGAALASGRRAVAVVGDGALLMANEISSAVQHRAAATWIVLNDARYGMCAQGMETLGLSADAEIPPVDFAAFARAQGAGAVRVERETDLDAALDLAMRAEGPFLVDVSIDRRSQAPASQRNAALAAKLDAHAERMFPAPGDGR